MKTKPTHTPGREYAAPDLLAYAHMEEERLRVDEPGISDADSFRRGKAFRVRWGFPYHNWGAAAGMRRAAIAQAEGREVLP